VEIHHQPAYKLLGDGAYRELRGWFDGDATRLIGVSPDSLADDLAILDDYSRTTGSPVTKWNRVQDLINSLVLG
jgi:hypothetical protein